MPVSRRHLIANAALFQIVWFACVLGGNVWALVATLVNAIVHVYYMSPPTRWWIYIALVGIIGFLFDLGLIQQNLLDFGEGNLNPPWLVLLWLNFAGTWHYSLNWLTKRPILAIILGGVAGAYSYYMGMILGAVSFPQPLWLTLPVLWLSWAAACGLLVFMCRHTLFNWQTMEKQSHASATEG